MEDENGGISGQEGPIPTIGKNKIVNNYEGRRMGGS